MENQILAVAYNKIRDDCRDEILKLERLVGEINEVFIFTNTNLNTDKKYPELLAGIPTKIITPNNLEDEFKLSLRNFKVIFLVEFLDSFLMNILKRIPFKEGYHLSSDFMNLTRVKNDYLFFNLLEKLPIEIIDNIAENDVTNISFNEEEWIINNEIEVILSEHFTITNVIALKHQDDFIFDAFISQLERKDDTAPKYII